MRKVGEIIQNGACYYLIDKIRSTEVDLKRVYKYGNKYKTTGYCFSVFYEVIKDSPIAYERYPNNSLARLMYPEGIEKGKDLLVKVKVM